MHNTDRLQGITRHVLNLEPQGIQQLKIVDLLRFRRTSDRFQKGYKIGIAKWIISLGPVPRKFNEQIDQLAMKPPLKKN